MSCTHTRWHYPPPQQDDWTGEMEQSDPVKVSTTEDIDIGRYRCTQCSKVMYYTGLWKEHWEGGRQLLDERTGHIKAPRREARTAAATLPKTTARKIKGE